jgi:hypothetical protein
MSFSWNYSIKQYDTGSLWNGRLARSYIFTKGAIYTLINYRTSMVSGLFAKLFSTILEKKMSEQKKTRPGLLQ